MKRQLPLPPLPSHLLILGIILLVSHAPAQTWEGMSIKDASIYEESNAANGTGDLFVGRTNAGPALNDAASTFRRSLIAFDLSEIPAGAQILSARIELRISKRSPSNFLDNPLSVHRLTADWGEGPSAGSGKGQKPAAGDVTYQDRFFGSAKWSTPGGDFLPEPSATVTLQPDDDAGVLIVLDGEGIANDVQHWIDNPDSNFGWILRANESEEALGSVVHFFSRGDFCADGSGPVCFGRRTAPHLVVEYSMDAPTTWAGFPMNENLDVNTGGWLGWINAADAPYIYIYSLQAWWYLPEAWVAGSGAWSFYIYPIGSAPAAEHSYLAWESPDGINVNTGSFLNWLVIQFRPLVFSYTLYSWAYLPEQAATPSGAWIYWLR